MYYIYILYSPGSDKYYIGFSDNPEQRLIRHNTSTYMTYTHKHRPWEVKSIFEIGESRSEAVRVECYLKKQKSRRLLECLIREHDISAIILKVLNR